MSKYTGRIFSYGSEMKTHVPQGIIWGLSIGLLIGIILSFSTQAYRLSLISASGAEPGTSKWVLMIFPIVGLLVGGAAGALIGVGVPKFNSRPEQGNGEIQETSKK